MNLPFVLENSSNSFEDDRRIRNNTSDIFDGSGINTYPILNYTEMRVNDYYKNYYINWTRNIFTGVLPIVSLIIFNQLVYKKLVTRRNLWKQGNIFNSAVTIL